MTKSLALTFVAVLSCLPFFGQGDANYDCQDVATCDTTVDFSFTLDANEFEAMAFPFTGGITAVGVTMDWSGDGITYPSDLSLSLCSPEGDCIAIYALGGTLPGTVVGAWPDSWNGTQDGIYSACFSLGENATMGSGEWILTGLNSFGSSTDNLAFQGSITLFYECSSFPVCEDVTACNFGSPADCVFPGCGEGNACNYDPDAACYDESTCTYDYCSTCPNAPCDSLIDFSFVLGP